MATTDGGMHWTKLSPDLGYPKGVTPPPDSLRGRGEPGTALGGAIQSLALSTVRRGVIWAGTSNGLIKLTKDEGKILPSSLVSLIRPLLVPAQMTPRRTVDRASDWIAPPRAVPGSPRPRRLSGGGVTPLG